MFRFRSFQRIAITCLAALLPAGAAFGEVFRDALNAIDFLGFNVTGQRNPISQGYTVSANRNFQNTPIDFGAIDLVLNGPVSGTFTTSERFLHTMDFSLNVGSAANPFQYSYVADVGSNRVQVVGSAVMGVNGSINQFGWYDMRVQMSSRQDIESSGRFANSDGEMIDFDIGPVDISGNIFADILAAITDPFFENSGTENIFAAFSGRTARENALESTVSQLESKSLAGKNLTSSEVSRLMTMVAEAQLRGDDVPDLGFLHLGDGETFSGSGIPQVAPEPSVLTMLLIPAVLLGSRRLRRRTAPQ
jgi:hypothetical protein